MKKLALLSILSGVLAVSAMAANGDTAPVSVTIDKFVSVSFNGASYLLHVPPNGGGASDTHSATVQANCFYTLTDDLSGLQKPHSNWSYAGTYPVGSPFIDHRSMDVPLTLTLSGVTLADGEGGNTLSVGTYGVTISAN